MTPGIANTCKLFEAVRRELSGALALGVALTSHRWLREKVRTAVVADADASVALQLPDRGGWLVLDSQEPVRLETVLPVGMPAVFLDRLLLLRQGLADEIGLALLGGSADRADRLLDPIYDVGVVMTRGQYHDLAEWAPYVSAAMFKAAIGLSAVLDDVRPELLARLRLGQHPVDALRLYWSAAHAMANMMILAARGGHVPLQHDLRSGIAWRERTPSMTFTRERTLWISAVGARVAVASGTEIVDVYLSALSAALRPLAAFDALFGLASVALARPEESRRISTEIELLMGIHLKQFTRSDPILNAAYDSALSVIRKAQAPASEARFLQPRLSSQRSFFLDPVAFSSNGRMNGFVALPHIVAAAPELLYPARGLLPRRRFFSGARVERVLLNAWSEDQFGRQLEAKG